MQNDMNDSRTNGHESTEGVPLLPCPFCGSADIMEGVYYAEGEAKKRGAVRCADCGVRAPTSSWIRRSSDWKPIETAPKNGALIIAYRGGWKDNRGIVLWSKDWDCWQSVPGAYRWEPTLWMPLPEAPK